MMFKLSMLRRLLRARCTVLIDLDYDGFHSKLNISNAQ
jgi:hypothetical protein